MYKGEIRMIAYNRRIALKKLLLEKITEIDAAKSDLKEAEKKMDELWDKDANIQKDLSYFMWRDKHIKLNKKLPDIHVQLYEILALLFEEDPNWFLEERYSIK